MLHGGCTSVRLPGGRRRCLRSKACASDPLGPLLFALTLQDALHHALQAAPDAGVFVVANDIYALGRPAATRVAFDSLTTPAASAP
jgi:hypothetical protein